MSPVLETSEAAHILSVTLEEVEAILPAFGDFGDRSVMRDDLIQLIETRGI
ncbi:MAG: hypothetical protein WCG80_16920 [Spirochaetales bacterium]